MNVTPPSIASTNVFSSVTYDDCELIVPKNFLGLYKNADVWTLFTNIREVLFGDADNDGSVTRNDAIAVMNYYLGKNNDINTEAADVNGDGKVTMADANAIRNMTLNEGSQESAYEGAYSSKRIYTYQTASDYDGFSTMSYSDGAKVQLIGNADKSFFGGSSITLIDGNSYVSTKVSNGAQNLFIAPEGMYVVGVNIYSYVNKVARTDRPAYWKEINGAYYSLDGEPILVDDVEIQTTKTTEMNSFSSNRDTPDVRSYTLPGVEEFTFTNTGEQLCFVMEVLYK